VGSLALLSAGCECVTDYLLILVQDEGQNGSVTLVTITLPQVLEVLLLPVIPGEGHLIAQLFGILLAHYRPLAVSLGHGRTTLYHTKCARSPWLHSREVSRCLPPVGVGNGRSGGMGNQEPPPPSLGALSGWLVVGRRGRQGTGHPSRVDRQIGCDSVKCFLIGDTATRVVVRHHGLVVADEGRVRTSVYPDGMFVDVPVHDSNSVV